MFGLQSSGIQAYQGLIRKYSQTPELQVMGYASTDSTNNRAKSLIAQNRISRPTLIVAEEQTGGRGQNNRAFFSPPQAGIYMSLVFKPDFDVEDFGLVTSLAGVITSQALDEFFEIETKIKWVNDIYYQSGKLGGILSESVMGKGSIAKRYIVIGIGINVIEPVMGFPENLADHINCFYKAGALSHRDLNDLRARIIARIADTILAQAPNISSKAHLAEYRNRSMLTGKTLRIEEGGSEFKARVTGINDDFTLGVQLEDGTVRALSSSSSLILHLDD